MTGVRRPLAACMMRSGTTGCKYPVIDAGSVGGSLVDQKSNAKRLRCCRETVRHRKKARLKALVL
jgi:hypothetical protein